MNNNNENKILEMAQLYFSNLAVTPIPVHPKSKKPVGEEWNKQKPTLEDLPQLFNNPELNVGVLLGTEYNLVSIDFDADKATGKLTPEGFSLMKQLVKRFPNTWLIQTGGGGTQMFFRPLPDKPIPRKIKLLSGVDLLGSGQAIVPPSIHPNGNEYKNVVLPESKEDIAIFPYEMFEEILVASNSQPNLNGKDYNEIFYEGERDDALTRYAGRVISKHPENEWETTCLPLIRDYNRQYCKPPLLDKESEKVFRSICKKELKQRKEEEEVKMSNDCIEQNANNEGRVAKIEKPENEVTLEVWREVVTSNFPDCLFAAEVAMSVVSQLLINDVTNPFALVLVGPPSSGKTITINFFAGIKEIVYSTDNFTPQSFVSHAANTSKNQLKEVDLLPRIKNKVMIIRELAPLFGQRSEDLLKSMGILTRVLDGEGLETDSGVHGKRGYSGEYLFMLLAASTPIQPQVWKLMGNLGSRLFFINVNSKDKSEDELTNQLINDSYKEKEKVCRETTTNLIYTLWNKFKDGVEWNKKKENPEYLSIVARCAVLLSKLRGTINVYRDRGSQQDNPELIHTIPIIEKPDRINQLFYNLCRGHALICGRSSLEKEDLKLVVEIAIDSAPTTRAKLFRKLLEYRGRMKTGDVEKELTCSKPTALNEMEALKVLGVVSISGEDYGEKVITLNEKLNWFRSDKCFEIRGIVKPITEIQLSKSDPVMGNDNQPPKPRAPRPGLSGL